MTAKAQDLRHKYDDPALSSVDFLLSVMRDRSVSIETRMDAAAKLLPIYRATPHVQTITITGGLPKELENIEARSDCFDWRDRPAKEPKSVH